LSVIDKRPAVTRSATASDATRFVCEVFAFTQKCPPRQQEGDNAGSAFVAKDEPTTTLE
jgi:hypothetical protein